MNAHSPEERLARHGVSAQHISPPLPFVDEHGRQFGRTISTKAKTESTTPDPLDIVTAASFAGRPRPEREFLIPGADLFPVRNVHALYGDGGTGKSLLMLQLAVAMSASASWMGFMPTPGSVLYFSAEDDADETHIRLADICDGSEVDLSSLARLSIAIMAGQDAILAAEDAKQSAMRATPLMRRLEATIGALRPRLVILDNLADIFSGNENVKALARQFIGMLRGLAIQYDTTIVIVAHPSLAGISSGTGTSGNTAWNNSVRSRLYLQREREDAEDISDPDFRRLVTMKANYSATGGEIGMRWERGRFVPTDVTGAHASQPSTLDRMAAGSKAERVFLQLLEWHGEKGVRVSPSTGANYAPAVFAKHRHSEGVKARQLANAMTALLDANRIEIVMEGPPSRQRASLVVRSRGEEA